MHQGSANSINPILEIEGLTLSFGGIRALNRVSFEVAPSSITSVIGPNGAGKTSLFNTVSGFYRPSAGRVRFFGEDIADARKFVSALIQIDYDTVAKWAENQRISFTHFRSLVEQPQVRELVSREVDKGNAQLAQVARIRRFHLLTKELDHDDGEVTATMKVRRSSIYKTYSAEIEAMYTGGSTNA